MTDTFHRLTIAAVRHLPAGAVDIKLQVPDDLRDKFAFKPGQHVMVRALIDGAEHRRSYSICSGRGGPLRLGIRQVAGGVVSTWAQTHLRAGDTLDVSEPKGRFTLPAPASPSPRHLLMFAGGAGITPILGMTMDALEHEPATRVTLIYGTRSFAQTMFLDDLEDLKDRYPDRLDIIHVLSGSDEADAPSQRGRMDGAKLRAFAQCRIDFKSVERAFICGPGSFIKEVRNTLFELGLPREAVHHEFFAGRTGTADTANATPPAAKAPEAAPAGSIRGTAILDGQRHAFALAPGQHVLDAALKAGIKAPYSCTGGMCSTCRARVVEGSATMTVNYSLEAWELERGFVLTCQSVVTSPTIVIDYDAM